MTSALSWYGKISYFIYGFVLVVGGATTILGMVAPVTAADCMADIFSPSDNNTVTIDQIVYFKAMGRMAGALGTVFLVAVGCLGHSTLSCILLLLWGFLNYVNFGIMIPFDFGQLGGGSEEAEACMASTGRSVMWFAVLEAVAVLFSLLEDWQHRLQQQVDEDNMPVATVPSEETHLQPKNHGKC
mmetsp:Transcript_37979/g.56478  ORF Transcript_37979/g.56478 Transcript_37979/m.56478 type:complete len:185 (-) Transcript_37979:238-792(-)|eukprot:CAMPEP_0194054786 /NCGR_PEP_ID=MMETSP0009_2-20130614/54540_1 /TAXON_ID=210454 /ORGANISM="Grammatophora oceanica, Strain CCMP 410" /LENGTH=184 /DNA_ID=CAMNT_0038703433 /DNA_START=843 /DNA_END=1397 /DNA_ORIENTATION=-